MVHIIQLRINSDDPKGHLQCTISRTIISIRLLNNIKSRLHNHQQINSLISGGYDNKFPVKTTNATITRTVIDPTCVT